MIKQYQVKIETSGRGFYDITPLVNDYVIKTRYNQGICSLFLVHTSASLLLCENTDEKVKEDLEKFFSRLVPDDSNLYHHNAEGKDDMPAHIRTTLTQVDLTIPIVKGRLGLGTWQSIYVWEHRLSRFHRSLILTLIGKENDNDFDS